MDKKKEKLITKKDILILAIITIYVVLLQVFKIHSPISYFFKVPTPTTGTTRAIIAFLKLDIKQAFERHPLFLLSPFYALSFFMYYKRKSRKTFIIVLSFTIIYLITYLIRLIWFTIPL